MSRAQSRAATVLPVHPGLLTRNYPKFGGGGNIEGFSLSDYPRFLGHLLGSRDLPGLERLLEQRPAPRRYVIMSPVQERVSDLYTVFPKGSFASLRNALADSPDFRLIYRYGDGYIFEYRPRRPRPD